MREEAVEHGGENSLSVRFQGRVSASRSYGKRREQGGRRPLPMGGRNPLRHAFQHILRDLETGGLSGGILAMTNHYRTPIRILEFECEKPPDARHRAARTLPESRRQSSGSVCFARLRSGLGIVFILTPEQSCNPFPRFDGRAACTVDKARRWHLHPAGPPAGIGVPFGGALVRWTNAVARLTPIDPVPDERLLDFATFHGDAVGQTRGRNARDHRIDRSLAAQDAGHAWLLASMPYVELGHTQRVERIGVNSGCVRGAP